MYQGLLGGAVTVPAALVLPKTGDNELLAITAVVSILVGVTIIVSSAARMVAKRANKA
jgi:hypothetical protein